MWDTPLEGNYATRRSHCTSCPRASLDREYAPGTRGKCCLRTQRTLLWFYAGGCIILRVLKHSALDLSRVTKSIVGLDALVALGKLRLDKPIFLLHLTRRTNKICFGGSVFWLTICLLSSYCTAGGSSGIETSGLLLSWM